MAKGTQRAQYLGSAGYVGTTTQMAWDFLYEASTTRNPLYNIGDRVVLPDGRVFRYAYTDTAVISYQGVNSVSDKAIGYESIGVAQDIGDKTVTVTETGFTLDQLRGGYIVIYGASNAAQNRGIIGNDASGATTTKIYLDGPLTSAVVADTTCVEMFYNPYAHVEIPILLAQNVSCLGVPAVSAAASSYVWIQTWGPCVVTGGEDVGHPADYARNLIFAGQNALYKNATYTSGQNAGFIITKGAAAYGPLIMLQISP